MRKFRIASLVALACGLTLWQWGPGWLDESRPLTGQVVAVGGSYRTVALPGGDSLLVVAHDIDRYCFSPGRGAIVELTPPTPGSAITTGAAILATLGGQALSEGRPNFTVTFERPVHRYWPWTERHLEFLVFHHGGRPAAWRITTTSGWLLRAARGYNDSTKASAAAGEKNRS
jgi:hypothetical protein